MAVCIVNVIQNNVVHHAQLRYWSPEKRNQIRVATRVSQARFKRRATAVPNSIDRIKFDLSTALARRLKPSRATRQ